jgi:light-regulated signal transduction histidine kinase (bacteriophytochrome)
MVEDLRRSEERNQNLNAELERRVRDRTAQLQAVNDELESFAYSVSHDLRAPLRAMDGFGSALKREYGGRMDAKALHYIDRIHEGASRMSQLIDDLLGLSRVTRSDFTRCEVDLGHIARKIVAELEAADPERRVDVRIQPGLLVRGDPNLLRIMLENLLGNAWKFTARAKAALIELGSDSQGDRRVYFLRDNGVGFDMAYADKLFAPFHRLHRMDDFPGTGIGLVTVQRIVHRHGGTIWPEAALGRGASFFFTLGDMT